MRFMPGVEILSRCDNNPKVDIEVYDLRQHNIDSLHTAIGLTDWTSLITSNDINYIKSNCVTAVHECMETAIPTKSVKTRRRDPLFVT